MSGGSQQTGLQSMLGSSGAGYGGGYAMPQYSGGGGYQQMQSPTFGGQAAGAYQQPNPQLGNPYAGGSPGSQGPQWSPAFNQYPQTSQTGSFQAMYPQLSGGYYNRMTQMLAGPQYQGAPPAPPPANPATPAQTPTPTPAPSPAPSGGAPFWNPTQQFQRYQMGSPNMSYAQ